jgi:1,2-phenylacetyl-CoA epoxidase catalytic subunit
VREEANMTGPEFTRALVAEMDALFAQLGENEILEAESGGQVEVLTLLELALASELEASELAGMWLATTPEIDAKALLAMQCGDEMKHYQLIIERLAELGRDVSQVDPLARGYSPLYQYLLTLQSTVERIAAGPFAREAIARVRNEQFMRFCRENGDEATAKLYEEVIQPEEIRHHETGRKVLERLCTTPELQARAREVTFAALAIADELGTLAARTAGLSMPGPDS